MDMSYLSLQVAVLRHVFRKKTEYCDEVAFVLTRKNEYCPLMLEIVPYIIAPYSVLTEFWLDTCFTSSCVEFSLYCHRKFYIPSPIIRTSSILNTLYCFSSVTVLLTDASSHTTVLYNCTIKQVTTVTVRIRLQQRASDGAPSFTTL